MDFTQEQITEILSEFSSKKENGYQTILKIALEAMMKSERDEFNLQSKDVSNGFRKRNVLSNGVSLELHVPRTRNHNFYPLLLALIKDQNKAPSKSTVSYQNQRRDWELFREYYYKLLETLGQQAYRKRVKFTIKSKIFLLDSTTISLCLSLFDWAKYKTSKGAVKMHTLLDYDGLLPSYVNITNGKTADNKGAYDVPLIKQSVIVADRFYNDFSLLNVWDSKEVFFVIRHKRQY